MTPMTLFTFAGFVAVTAGCTCLYLSSPNQRWLAGPWPAGPARAAGAALLALGALGLAQRAQALTAVFIFVTAAMLVFVALPYLGAFLDARRDR